MERLVATHRWACTKLPTSVAAYTVRTIYVEQTLDDYQTNRTKIKASTLLASFAMQRTSMKSNLDLRRDLLQDKSNVDALIGAYPPSREVLLRDLMPGDAHTPMTSYHI